MSISTEISRIKAAKESLKSAINARGGTLTTELLDDYAAAVTALPTGGGDIDLSGVTVTADKLLEGIVAINGAGLKVTGTIKSVTASISGDNVVVPAGFHPEAKSFPVSGGGADVSAVTVTASDILKGKIAVNAAGQQITGTIETVTATLNANTVSVPKGYIASAQTLTVPEAKSPTVSGNVVTVYQGYQKSQTTATVAKATATLSANVVTIPEGYHDANTLTVAESQAPTVADNKVTVYQGYNKEQKTITVTEASAPSVSGNVVTFGKGYNATEKKITVGTAKGAETITPGTADKTIAKDTYLTGDLTVKGEPNWTEENIAEGVSMWGKVGTFKGGGGETVTFGYIDEWGKFQAIDLSAIPPVTSGESVETDLVVFALPYDIEDSLEVAAYNVYINTTIADILNKDTEKWCLENIEGNLLLSDDSISKRTMYGCARADGTEYRLIWYPSSNCYVLLRGYTDIICELTGKINPSYLDGTYTAVDGTTVIISKYEA